MTIWRTAQASGSRRGAPAAWDVWLLLSAFGATSVAGGLAVSAAERADATNQPSSHATATATVTSAEAPKVSKGKTDTSKDSAAGTAMPGETVGTAKKNSSDLPITPDESAAAIADLRKKNLLFPIKDFDVARIKGSFNEKRGSERHGASDILAPRGTPIMAIEDGVVAKLFESKFGGITIYQFDPQKKYVYYYAHLEKYAAGLKDGGTVKKGQVIGYVGTSGDAPKDTPHLHLCISIPSADKKWWQSAPVDPYEVFRP